MGNHGAAGCVTTVLRSVLTAIFTEPPLLYAGDATEFRREFLRLQSAALNGGAWLDNLLKESYLGLGRILGVKRRHLDQDLGARRGHAGALAQRRPKKDQTLPEDEGIK